MDIKNICEEVRKIATEVGLFLKSEQPKLKLSDIEYKGVRNYVTYLDKEAEELLISKLKPLISDATFLTEESTVSYQEGEYTWIIDPIDGTTNFIHGDFLYSISIALKHKDKIVLGVVHAPVLGDTFWATENEPARLNGKPLNVSSHSTIEDGFISMGIPYISSTFEKEMLLNIIAHSNNCTLRLKGSSALEICYVALGCNDAFFHSSLSAWDVAAATLIVTQAGGQCTDFKGGDNYLFGGELIASNGKIHSAIMDTFIPK